MAKATASRPAGATRLPAAKAGARRADRSAVTGQFVTVGPRGGETAVRIKVTAAAPVRAGQSYVLLADPEPETAHAARAFKPGPWARALLVGKQLHMADLETSGGAYDLEQVQLVLGGISRSQVAEYVKTGKLLAVPGPSNRRRYPAVQFDERGRLIAGIAEVQKALADSPWIVLNFLIRPDDRLQGQRPIDLLKQGKVDAVVAAARRLGEPGA
jgi:hypothetical protein